MSDDQSYVEYGATGGTSFVGPDAVQLYQVIVLISAMRLYVKSRIKVNRAYTPKNMLATAARLTGKTYKRTELAKAADDLQGWADMMKAALPVLERENRSQQ
jgi:hypothetical protein